MNLEILVYFLITINSQGVRISCWASSVFGRRNKFALQFSSVSIHIHKYSGRTNAAQCYFISKSETILIIPIDITEILFSEKYIQFQ